MKPKEPWDTSFGQIVLHKPFGVVCTHLLVGVKLCQATNPVVRNVADIDSIEVFGASHKLAMIFP